MNETTNRISAFRQWKLSTRQYFLILLSAKKDLMISLAFPIIAAVITIWIAGEDMFYTYEGTKSACFVLVSSAIWGGLFNSIQTVVKERANVRRDYMAGLCLRSYVASRAVLQFFLCALQSLILCLGILGVNWVYDNSLPESGLVFDAPMADYYISILLIMYSADAMGLLFSCMVKKAETANVMAPYVLIVQLIFSGILFDMEGFSNIISYLMLSRWGMEAMGSISDLNNMTTAIQLEIPNFAHEAESMFDSTTGHLVLVWVMLAVFAIGFILVGDRLLHRIAKDTR